MFIPPPIFLFRGSRSSGPARCPKCRREECIHERCCHCGYEYPARATRLRDVLGVMGSVLFFLVVGSASVIFVLNAVVDWTMCGDLPMTHGCTLAYRDCWCRTLLGSFRHHFEALWHLLGRVI